MKRKLTIIPLYAIAVIAALITPQVTFGDVPGRHPGYLHAISDLRLAKRLLSREDAPKVEGDEHRAIREIDACIHDLTQASWYDEKGVASLPHPDSGMDWSGRLHKALDVLRKAHGDMDKEEDDPAAVGFQIRAIKHVDRAIGFTRRAIGDKFNDDFLR
jgi:hypothetical protein